MTDNGIRIPMTIAQAAAHREPPCRTCGSPVNAYFAPDSDPGKRILVRQECSVPRCPSRRQAT